MNINYKKPAFKSSSRCYNANVQTVIKPDSFAPGNIVTLTWLFRGDLEWEDLVRYCESNFKDKKRVKVHSLASSDGSEAYTFAISVLENLPKTKWSKYLPLYASDIDSEVIKAGKSGKINLLTRDLEKLIFNTRGIHRYFQKQRDVLPTTYDGSSELFTGYKIIGDLAGSVKFKQADILSELKKLKDDGDSVIMCRNVLPYLKKDCIDKIIQTASEKLKTGSLFVIGNYDKARIPKLSKQICENGFELVMKNVYRKI